MLPDHPHYCLGITGISGSGKTTFLSRFLASPRSKATVRFIFDPRGSLIRRLNRPAALNAQQLAAQLASGWVCFYPFPMFRNLAAAADWFSGFALTAAEAMPGRKFAVFDELQLYGDGSRPPERLVDVFNTGRNFGVDAAYVTQSFGEVSRELVKQTSEAVAFHTTDSSNGWWLRKWGFDVAAVERLAPGSYHARDLMRSRGAVGRVF